MNGLTASPSGSLLDVLIAGSLDDDRGAGSMPAPSEKLIGGPTGGPTPSLSNGPKNGLTASPSGSLTDACTRANARANK